MSQFSIFDSERQLEKIHQLNSFLPKLKSLINFEMFRPVIDQARPPKPQPNGGRPPYDNVLLAKVLILKYLYQLFDNGFEAKGGHIVDVQFVDAPKQRNSREENDQIKNGETPERFERNPNVLRHKDLDDRWTKKNNEAHYGYKDHVKQDVEHKFIRDYSVTSAEVQKLSNHKVRCRVEHVFDDASVGL